MTCTFNQISDVVIVRNESERTWNESVVPGPCLEAHTCGIRTKVQKISDYIPTLSVQADMLWVNARLINKQLIGKDVK